MGVRVVECVDGRVVESVNERVVGSDDGGGVSGEGVWRRGGGGGGEGRLAGWAINGH